MSDGSRMNATVVSLTKKKGMSWGIADLSIVYSISLAFPIAFASPDLISHHLLRSNLSLLVLSRDERRACHARWANGGGRAECGPREGAEEAGVHAGRVSMGCGSARLLRRGELFNWRCGSLWGGN